ncbi:nuclear polyadenosine RNA-binding 2 isoform X2 [Lycorma delicatula]|uniref:nuclear polyadenosine RNA-binding 2 isoform X2 n=1 Tax=Lycorma delicatula TaxID=130591 RepID=UPI003F510EB3
MEGLGAEVTQKIKSAIQAKLMELGVYVDDELPDYVMVMVGNKRSKTQMENDLQLFLGANTIPFTSWLYQVLQKLQEVTVASKSNSIKAKKKERTPSIEEDQDFINIKAETDGDLIEEEIPVKRKQLEKTVKTRTDRSSEKSVEYLPSKIKDRVKSVEDHSERKVEKINKETNTIRKRSSRDDPIIKKSSLGESGKSSSREDINKKEELKKRQNSCSPIRERSSDKVIYDARELLNRKKAEKLASSKDKDISKQSEQVKRKRERSSEERHSKRTVSHSSDANSISHRLSALRDNERERNGRDKDSSLKSTVHRTALKRKTLDDDKIDDRSDRRKDDKRSDIMRSNKVIRISETVQAEQEILKPRSSSKTVIPPVERKNVHSRTAVPKESNRDVERDRERERDSGVSSVVRITPRPKRPASQQPSSSLILKAVAEANKSLAAAPSRPHSASDGDTSMKTSVSERLVSVKRVESVEVNEEDEQLMEGQSGEENRSLERPVRGKISPDKITITLPNHRVQPVTKGDTGLYSIHSTLENSKSHLMEDINEDLNKEESQSSVVDKDGANFSTNASCSTNSHVTTISDKGKEVDDAINQWLKGVEEADPIKPLPDSFSSQETDLDSEPVLEICQNMSELEPEEEPEFVVTLHGLDPDMFPKVNDNEDEFDEKDCKLEEDIGNENDKNKSLSAPSSPTDSSPNKKKRTSSPIIIVKQTNNQVNNEGVDTVKLKSLERCKYWPNCLLGDKCSYHHPSTMCNAFPACKYGDNCLFIHPPCKFGLACTRRDCLYMHGTPTVGIPKSKINPLAGTVQYCRFYPNCSNLNCQFYHPKPCRFGRYCTKKDCTFDHKKGPTKDKHKWTRLQT